MENRARQATGYGAGLAGAIALIIAAVLGVEGGYVNDPDDPGGETNFGITEKTARQCGYQGDMRRMTREFAIACYTRLYVTEPGFDRFVSHSVALGEEITDTGVNFGPYRPSCYAQKALNSLNRGERDYPDIVEDCRVGPATAAAYAALARKRGQRQACELMIKLMDAQQGAEYLRLTSEVSPTLEKYMPGWADKRLGNVPLERCLEGGAQ